MLDFFIYISIYCYFISISLIYSDLYDLSLLIHVLFFEYIHYYFVCK